MDQGTKAIMRLGGILLSFTLIVVGLMYISYLSDKKAKEEVRAIKAETAEIAEKFLVESKLNRTYWHKDEEVTIFALKTKENDIHLIILSNKTDVKLPIIDEYAPGFSWEDNDLIGRNIIFRGRTLQIPEHLTEKELNLMYGQALKMLLSHEPMQWSRERKFTLTKMNRY